MAAHHDVERRRGWLFVFLLVHVAFMVMNASALVSTVRQRALTDAGTWELAPGQFEGIMLMDRWGTFGRLSLLAAGIYLMVLIARGDERVPKYYVWYGGAFLLFEALLNLAQLPLWGIPRGTPWAWFGVQMILYAAALATWVGYVWRSKMVRVNFAVAPRTMGTWSRLLVGLGAIPLITWPFVLNNYVETIVALAATMTPKSTSAGMGLAEGILLASVVIGLFVLMKNAWRMKNAWIAVLLPVSFSVLFLLFVMQAFLMHYGS